MTNIAHNWRYKHAKAAASILTATGLVLSSASLGLIATTSIAQAATFGPGHHTGPTTDDVNFGIWITSNGEPTVCLQFGVLNPSSNQMGLTAVDTVNGLSGVQLAKLNFLLDKYIYTQDNNLASALAWAAWFYQGDVDANGVGYDANAGVTVNILDSWLPDQSQRPAIVAAFNAMVADAEANYTMATGYTPTAEPTLTIGADSTHGTVTIPEGYNTMTLTNARFDGNNSATMAVPYAGGTYSWTGVIPDSATNTYSVSVNASYDNNGTGAWVNVAYSENPAQQTLGKELRFTGVDGSRAAQINIPIGFSPAVSSQVPTKNITNEDTITDRIRLSTLTTAEGAPAGYDQAHRRFSDGTWAPVTLRATITHSLHVPTPGQDIPDNVRIVGTYDYTTNPSVDPNAWIDIDTGIHPDEAGLYNLQWEIVNPQPAPTVNLIPAGWNYKDDYGLDNETQIRATDLEFVTQLSANKGTPGTVVQDGITATIKDGGWIQQNRERIPVSLEGVATWVPEKPVVSAMAPANAEVVGTYTLEANAPNTTFSEDISVPYKKGGYLVLQWCVAEESKQYFGTYCDDWGLPAESLEIVVPTITTKANPTVAYGDIEDFYDIATTKGEAYPADSQIVFTAYRKVVEGEYKYNASGDVLRDAEGVPLVWTAEDIASYTTPLALCTAQPVFSTSGTPISVSADGDYKSAHPDKLMPVGTYHWVEQGVAPNPETPDVPFVWAEGECGIPNETTNVVYPNVTTNAGGDKLVGSTSGDTATVTNVSENEDINYEIVFDLFKLPAEGGSVTLPADGELAYCTPANRVFTTEDKPLAVTKDGEYYSEEYTYKTVGTYFWVEKLYTEDGELVKQGKCGEPGETVNVTVQPPVPEKPKENKDVKSTNSENSPYLGLLAGGISLLVAGAGTALFARRTTV